MEIAPGLPVPSLGWRTFGKRQMQCSFANDIAFWQVRRQARQRDTLCRESTGDLLRASSRKNSNLASRSPFVNQCSSTGCGEIRTGRRIS